jgi:hypothetical protein
MKEKLMFRNCKLALLALVVVAAAGHVRCEEGGQSHPLRKSYFTKSRAPAFVVYFRSKSIRDEIGLSDTQTKQIAALGKRKQAADVAEKLQTILRPDQINRALEIVAQLNGPVVLFDYFDDNPELAKRIELTAEQAASIKSIGNETVQSTQKALQAALDDMNLGNIDQRTKAAYLRQFPISKAAGERIRKILTPKQLELLKKLQGKEIDAAKIQAGLDDSFGKPWP